ncbi:hypothetical protein [Rhodococcus sp. P1Y]|uniref:hypothetical protein n=1 Tax=Rhodococcus sp. P1Y TaxID=1302308 RepID=UPI001914B5A0|nr:hypothetical protein [Rhodococcus sp. P1Y]
MSPTLWLLLIASVLYVFGRRRSRRNLVMCAQLLGAAAVVLVLGQVLWSIVGE